MRETKTRTVAEPKPLGVIDSVSAGIGLVWRRPWTLVVPILLDAMIWLFPRLSLTEYLRPFHDDIMRAIPLSTDPQAVQETQAALQSALESLNILGFVAAALNGVTRIPTLLAIDAPNVASPFATVSYSIQSPALILLLFVPMFVLGLLLVALYLELVAQGARPLETSTRDVTLMRIGKLWLRLIGLALLFLVLLLAAIMILVGVQLVFSSPELAAFATLLMTVGLFWVFIYFFFVPSAAAVSEIGIRSAVRRSSILFRVFFWSTLALVALSVFLDRGLAIVWDGFTVNSIGVAIGIVANAFIGTALIAASMIYYQDRMNLLERLRQSVKIVKK